MPKSDYIIPVLKGSDKRNVKAFVNLRTKQCIKTGSWDRTPNELVSEYCPKPASESYRESWDRVFGRRNG
jgi:hypothetical protein